jgi:hypothetical protein
LNTILTFIIPDAWKGIRYYYFWHVFVINTGMKKQLLVMALLLSSLSMQLHAQVRFSVNINAQPVWGPVGYDRADYYYLPDIETYYSVPRHLYYYYDDGRWVSSAYLPSRYRDYDLYHGYKVVVNDPYPWQHHERYRDQYGQYRGRHDQEIIRDSRDERYYANPGHPEHRNWVEHHGEGHGEGHGEWHDNGHHGEGHGDGGHHGEGHEH